MLSTEILCFSFRKNMFLKKNFTPGLQNDLHHNITIFPTCPQHFGYPMKFGGCNWGCLIEKNGGAIPLKVLKKLIPLRLKKQLSNRFGCWNCSICLSKCMLLAWITAYHGLIVVILEPQLPALRSYWKGCIAAMEMFSQLKVL